MDLMIKIKTYVYTYGGLFSSKLKLINSRIQLFRVNQDTFSKACLVCLWQLQFLTCQKVTSQQPREIQIQIRHHIQCIPIQTSGAIHVQVREMGFTRGGLLGYYCQVIHWIWYFTNFKAYKDEYIKQHKDVLVFLEHLFFNFC